MNRTRDCTSYLSWGAVVGIISFLLGGSWFLLTALRPVIQGIGQGLAGR